jgi:outer membrane protein TolC
MRRHSPTVFYRVGLFLALFSVAPVGSFSQAQSANGSAAMTLDQAVERANANYPAIKAAQAQQRAAQGAIGVARAAYLPRTDLLWQTNRATANNIYGLLLPQGVIPSISGPAIDSDVTRSAWSSGGGALINWQPFDFGVRRAKVDVAREGSEAAKQGASLTALEVGAAAGAAFFDLAAAQQLVAVAEANIRRYESFNKAVHVLVDNALRAGADASQADAQLALARNQLIQARTQAAVRRSALASYLQVPADHVDIDSSDMLKGSLPSDVNTTAAMLHPAVLQEKAFSLQQEAQKHALDRSYAPMFNTLGAVSGRGAGTDLTGRFPGGSAGLAPNTLNWALGVQVTFSALDFFNIREQKKVQEANVQAEHARYDLSLSNVSAAVEQARATLAGAKQIAANTPTELLAAQASEQQQQARYRSGLATVVDVAAAEGILAQAEGDDVLACLGVWRAEFGVAVAQGDLVPFLQQLKSLTKGN